MIINKKYSNFAILIITSLLFLCNCQNLSQEKPTATTPDNCFVTPPTIMPQDIKKEEYLELTYPGNEQPIAGQMFELEIKNLSQEYIRFPDGYKLIILQETGQEMSFDYIHDLINDDQQKSFVLEPSGLQNDHKIIQLLPDIEDGGEDHYLRIAIVGQRYIDGKTCKDSYGTFIRLTIHSANGNQD